MRGYTPSNVMIIFAFGIIFFILFVSVGISIVEQAVDIKKQEDCIIFNGEEYCRR